MVTLRRGPDPAEKCTKTRLSCSTVQFEPERQLEPKGFRTLPVVMELEFFNVTIACSHYVVNDGVPILNTNTKSAVLQDDYTKDFCRCRSPQTKLKKHDAKKETPRVSGCTLIGFLGFDFNILNFLDFVKNMRISNND